MTSKLGLAMIAGMMAATPLNPYQSHRKSGELHKEPGHKKLRAKRKVERKNKRNGRNK